MAFADLTPAQQQAFRDRLAQAGIDPADVVKRVGPDTHPGQLVASADPEESTIRPHSMRVRDVETMKALAGNPDEHYEKGLIEEHHEIPEPWPQERGELRRQQALPAERAQIHQAHLVWLYGNSQRVQSYRDVINKVEYPKVIPVFAAEELVITASNSPYVITAADSGHIYGDVTIYAGGSLQFEGNVDFHCQRMTKSNDPGPSSQGNS